MRPGVCHPPFEEWRRGKVEHDEVRLLACCEVADAVVQIQRTGGSECGEIERGQWREAMAAHLCDLVRLVERAQHGKTGPGADVGAEPHSNPVRHRGVGVEKSASEEQVRRGAERHCGAGFSHAGPVGSVEMDAVRVYGALAHQTKMVVYVEVAAAPGIQLRDPCNLAAVLRKVRLQIYARAFV